MLRFFFVNFVFFALTKGEQEADNNSDGIFTPSLHFTAPLEHYLERIEMRRFILFATMWVLLVGLRAPRLEAQTATFVVTGFSSGTDFAVRKTESGVDTVSVPKGLQEVLKVRCIATFDPFINFFVMRDAYGTNSSFLVRPGSTQTSFGQYLNVPLCLGGINTYTVEYYNILGRLVTTKQLDINLIDLQ